MNTRKQAIITTIGFLLVGIGLLALILSLVGVKLSFLVWLDSSSRLFGFVGKLVMIIVGFILIYVAQTDLEQEEI